jgi:hypothetical protein
LNVLMADVNRQAVASRPDRLMLHGAAVSVGGSGLVLVGPSGAGKSSLAAALVLGGAGYLTDEAVCVDMQTTMIDPYPKPLSLSAESRAVLRLAERPDDSDLVPPDDLRAGSVGPPVPARALFFLKFEPRGSTQVEPMSRGQAMVELANGSFNFIEHGGRWLPGLRDVVAGCRCWRVVTGDSSEAARVIEERIAA